MNNALRRSLTSSLQLWQAPLLHHRLCMANMLEKKAMMTTTPENQCWRGTSGHHGTTCMHITSRRSKPMSHLSPTWPKWNWSSFWLHRVNRERQIHSPGGMTTWPGFPYSVRPLDVTWQKNVLKCTCWHNGLIGLAGLPVAFHLHSMPLKVTATSRFRPLRNQYQKCRRVVVNFRLLHVTCSMYQQQKRLLWQVKRLNLERQHSFTFANNLQTWCFWSTHMMKMKLGSQWTCRKEVGRLQWLM